MICPAEGLYGVQIPVGAWHTIHVIEPSVIFEAKDGRFGEDGSETKDKKPLPNPLLKERG